MTNHVRLTAPAQGYPAGTVFKIAFDQTNGHERFFDVRLIANDGTRILVNPMFLEFVEPILMEA